MENADLIVAANFKSKTHLEKSTYFSQKNPEKYQQGHEQMLNFRMTSNLVKELQKCLPIKL
jgi:hypothetical protein